MGVFVQQQTAFTHINTPRSTDHSSNPSKPTKLFNLNELRQCVLSFWTILSTNKHPTPNTHSKIQTNFTNTPLMMLLFRNSPFYFTTMIRIKELIVQKVSNFLSIEKKCSNDTFILHFYYPKSIKISPNWKKVFEWHFYFTFLLSKKYQNFPLNWKKCSNETSILHFFWINLEGKVVFLKKTSSSTLIIARGHLIIIENYTIFEVRRKQ